MGLEIERKYLIKMPKREELLACTSCVCDKIEQTYLLSDAGVTARVRKRENQSRREYTHTEKIRLTSVTCIENERIITEKEYLDLLETRNSSLATVKKLRYSFPYGKRIVEIDVYPFWENVAILEIELEDENEEMTIPDFITVICEVTEKRQFKNRAIAEKIPDITEFLANI